MSTIHEYFAKYYVLFDQLEKYGFKLENKVYVYSFLFYKEQFQAEIKINSKGQIFDRVIELSLNEEFDPIYTDYFVSGFVSEVKDAYLEKLKEIRKACFSKQLFVSRQANLVVSYCSEKHHETPDFPFKNLTDYGVFRLKDNKKWFALIMRIEKNKVTKNKDDKGSVDVINLKVDMTKKEKLLKVKGILPAYHMNKMQWITILLDDEVDDELLFSLIEDSRRVVFTKAKERNEKEKRYYLQPVNPSFYDLDKAIEEGNGTFLWKQSRNVAVEDLCYMYYATPEKRVKYRCKIVEINIDFPYQDKNVSMKKVMKLKVESQLDVPISYLHEIGITVIRGPVSLSEKQASLIDKQK